MRPSLPENGVLGHERISTCRDSHGLHPTPFDTRGPFLAVPKLTCEL